MANSTLKAISPLGDHATQIGDTQLYEVTDLDIVSMAIPAASVDVLNAALQNKFGVNVPLTGFVHRSSGRSSDSNSKNSSDSIALLGLQSDQCFVVARTQSNDPVASVASITGTTAYLTDQSDSWVVIELKGPSAGRALERICPIDLSADVFNTLNVARTSMEHLSVIIEKPEDDTYRLYSPRSSADSFLHALTVSLHNVTSYNDTVIAN